MQKQLTEFKNATHNELRCLTEISERAGLLEGAAIVLTTQFDEMGKTRYTAGSSYDGLLREVRALEARVRILRDELDSLKRR